MLAWLIMAHVWERGPRTQQIAWQITSAVNFTRSAVVSAEPLRRPTLLAELARDEGVRISIAEPSDKLIPLANTADNRAVVERIKNSSGMQTRVAASVNGEEGFWVSFDIAGDEYWLGFDHRRFQASSPKSLIGWAIFVGALALVAAAFVTKIITAPLQQLGKALTHLLRGEPTPALDTTKGPTEIRLLNRRFNLMSQELERVESDRALALAGVSHDIRTPLTRMRMEIELSSLDSRSRESLIEEIERIDSIVGQFIEFSNAAQGSRVEIVDIYPLVETLTAREIQLAPAGSACNLNIPKDLHWTGSALDLERMLSNLLANARRYGQTASRQKGDILLIDVHASIFENGIRIVVQDRGLGVPENALERLLRPFARLDIERSQAAGGSGLGLAIVARLARRYQGQLQLSNRAAPETGLVATLILANAESVSVLGK
jgi:two-component system, OmpR family, osmolarity sensor histidine kinase EnvZ